MKIREHFHFREPLGSYLGKWEGDLLRTHTTNWAVEASRAVEKFFEWFPRKRHPAQVQVTDVEDWKEWRRPQIALTTLQQELTALRSFYRYCAIDLGLDVCSPVIQIPAPRRGPARREEIPVDSPPHS